MVDYCYKYEQILLLMFIHQEKYKYVLAYVCDVLHTGTVHN